MKHWLLALVAAALTACRQPTAAPPTADNARPTATGYAINLPEGMQKARQNSEFEWWRTGPAYCQMHLCLYAYRSDSLNAAEYVERRNDIMRRNIKGASDSIYMSTFVPSVRSQKARRNGRTVMRISGMWQMEGDMMGGPFVSHCILDSPTRRVVVAEAFVYAPDYDKTAMMNRLEKAVQTLHPLQKKARTAPDKSRMQKETLHNPRRNDKT